MRRNNHKKAMAILTVMIMLISALNFGVYAEENDTENHGYHDVEFETYVVPDDPSVKKSNKGNPGSWNPIKDADKQSWFPTGVLSGNQGDDGTCWSFGAVNSADISYAKETNNSGIELSSPLHMAYSFYNRKGDALTSGDRNTTPNNWRTVGGNSVFTFQSFANRDGVVSATACPYDSRTPNINTQLHRVAEQAEILDYKPSDMSDVEYRSAVKQMIMEYGAAVISFYSDSYYFNTQDGVTTFYRSTDNSSTTHCVTLVGWDDDFSRDKFGSHKPSHDGAWLIVNSYANKPNKYANNMFWMSYDEGSFYSEAVAFDMKPYDENETLYQYDGTAGYKSQSCSAGDKVASIYTAQNDLYINEVGFTEYNYGETKYDINIYKGAADESIGEITLDSPVETLKNVSTTRPGYHSFKLGKSVSVNESEKFVVEIVFDSYTLMGIEQSYSNGSWITFSASIGKNQSFKKSKGSGSWQDGSSLCYRIKAVTSSKPTAYVCTNDEVKNDTTVTEAVATNVQTQLNTALNIPSGDSANFKYLNITPSKQNQLPQTTEGKYIAIIPYDKIVNDAGQNNYDYAVYHITGDNDDSYEQINCTKTAAGLMIETSSFSTFAIGYAPLMKGDINDDRQITLVDIEDFCKLLVTNKLQRISNISDINGDKAVDIRDIIDLRNESISE